MDEIDHAQEREQIDRDLALAALRARIPTAPPYDGQPRACESCGDEIDPRRLAAQPGAERCMECQQRQEKFGV